MLYPLPPSLIRKLAAWVERVSETEEGFTYVLGVTEERRKRNLGRRPDRRVELSLAHLAAAITREESGTPDAAS